ncbi:MAG: outer membrane beta-barrel domain-containing protein [Bdellovibrio sp.]|jgi:outer membrane immunogenic protein
MKLQSVSLLTLTILLASSVGFAKPVKSTPRPTAKKTVAQQSPKKNIEKKINVAQDVDTLGGNEALFQMASSMDPDNRARIVQSRLVDRYNRFELGVSYGGVAGGDAYMKTQSLGASIDFHFTPRWSLGVRYYDYGNDLTPEGRRSFEQAKAAYEAGGRSYQIPDIDYPLNSAMAILNWYPIYGKTNLMDWGIAQFDMYLLAGGGQIQMSSGSAPILTGGAGLGVWMTKHLSARAEIRYQNYKDQIITGSRNIDTVVGTFGLGFLL